MHPPRRLQFAGREQYMSHRRMNHWDPFFVNIAGKYGLDEERLRKEFATNG